MKLWSSSAVLGEATTSGSLLKDFWLHMCVHCRSFYCFLRPVLWWTSLCSCYRASLCWWTMMTLVWYFNCCHPIKHSSSPVHFGEARFCPPTWSSPGNWVHIQYVPLVAPRYQFEEVQNSYPCWYPWCERQCLQSSVFPGYWTSAAWAAVSLFPALH